MTTIKELLNHWDNGFVNLKRKDGKFKSFNVRLRNCSLHYSNATEEYFVEHRGGVTYSLDEIEISEEK